MARLKMSYPKYIVYCPVCDRHFIWSLDADLSDVDCILDLCRMCNVELLIRMNRRACKKCKIRVDCLLRCTAITTVECEVKLETLKLQ